MLSGVFKYIQKVIQGHILDDYEFYIEYNIGWQICKYLGVAINIACPHRFKPNVIYKEILDIIRDNGIPAELLIEGKVKNIYKYIISKECSDDLYPMYSRMHDPIFPNYLKSFNFRVHHNLLPVKRLFRDFALDNDSACNFCNLHPETHSHIFSQCKRLDLLWKFLDEVLILLNINSEDFNFAYAREMYNYDMINTRFDLTGKNYILYLNSIVNHNIWRYSKKIQYEKVVFDDHQLIKNVVKTLFARKNIDDRLKQCSKIDDLENLCTAANFVKNVYVQAVENDDT